MNLTSDMRLYLFQIIFANYIFGNLSKFNNVRGEKDCRIMIATNTLLETVYYFKIY